MSRVVRWRFGDLRAAGEAALAAGQPLLLRWIRGRRSGAAVAVGFRAGGFLVAVPAEFLGDDELTEARVGGFQGDLGPCYAAEARLVVGDAFPEGEPVVDVLLIDLEGPLAREFVTHVPGAYRGYLPFQADGHTGWPDTEDLVAAAGQFTGLGGPEPEEERLAGYAEAGEEEAASADEALVEAPRAEAEGEVPAEGEGLVAVAAAGGRAVEVRRPGLGVGRRAVPLGRAAPGPRLPGAARRDSKGPLPFRAEMDELRREVRSLRAAKAVDLDGEAEEEEPARPKQQPASASDPQFFAEGRRLGLSDGELQRLLGLAGPPPARLADPSRLRPPGRVWGGAAASSGETAPVEWPRAPAAAAVAPGPAEGTNEVMRMLLAQNEMLLRMMTSRQEGGSAPSGSAPGTLDALLAAGGGGLLDDSKVSGARGCAARIALKQQLASRPSAGTAAIRRNLAQALDRTVESLQPGDMRRYFSEAVPFGSYTGLTYSGFLLAKLWEEAEELAAQLSLVGEAPPEITRCFEKLHLTIGLGCVFTEQVATEGGARYQLGWLLTGLEEPPFASTSAHKPRPGSLPHGRLVEAQWVAAQLAYLRDLDLMQERMRRQNASDEKPKGGGKGERDAKASP